MRSCIVLEKKDFIESWAFNLNRVAEFLQLVAELFTADGGTGREMLPVFIASNVP